MSGKKHHVHANIHAVSSGTPELFERAGFVLDPFVMSEGSYAPPMHYSVEVDDTLQARAAWAAAVEIMEGDSGFSGYIEFETLNGVFEAELSESQYVPVGPFPLAVLPISEVPPGRHKHADLHVKRSAHMVRDQLDEELTSCGFYEVRTERNRIYTLQCERAEDARRIFSELREFLAISGGAKQANFEVIGRFLRKPIDFRLPRYLPAQADDAWDSLIRS